MLLYTPTPCPCPPCCDAPAAGPAWVQVGGLASLAPPDSDLREFFTSGALGAARRPCPHLAAEVQVAHRCHCTDPAVCGELEKRVAELAAAGKLPPFPVEGHSLPPPDLGMDSW